MNDPPGSFLGCLPGVADIPAGNSKEKRCVMRGLKLKDF
jgi:hypothetical protein